MVALPGQLFYSTQISACLWFLARDRGEGKHRDRRGAVHSGPLAERREAGGPRCTKSAVSRARTSSDRPAPGAVTTAPRSRRQRCGPGSAGWASRHAASTPAVPGRTATGNPSPARAAPRAATPRSARPAPKPRSASSAGGARTTRCARTAPSGPGRPPRQRWRSDGPTPRPGQAGGCPYEPRKWHNDRGQVSSAWLMSHREPVDSVPCAVR